MFDCRSFLQALLPQLQQLAPLVTGSRTGKELFLRLLGKLLALSARTVLSPTQPAFAFVLDSYVALLGTKCAILLEVISSCLVYFNHIFLYTASTGVSVTIPTIHMGCRGNATADAQIRCQALVLLPFFLEHGAADHQKRVLAGVEGLVSGCFPLSSWELPRGSTQVRLPLHVVQWVGCTCSAAVHDTAQPHVSQSFILSMSGWDTAGRRLRCATRRGIWRSGTRRRARRQCHSIAGSEHVV